MQSAKVTPEMARRCSIVDAWKMLVTAGACKSISDARRAFEGNSVKFHNGEDWELLELFNLADGQKPRFTTVGETEGKVIRVGKRTHFKVVFPK